MLLINFFSIVLIYKNYFKDICAPWKVCDIKNVRVILVRTISYLKKNHMHEKK